jgi:hypothetical protein
VSVFLRSLWADLVEKRLWPVALLLVVALIAVPVALGHSGAAGTTATAPPPGGPAPAAPAAPAGATKVVSDPSPSLRRHVTGAAHDPFRQPAVAASAAQKDVAAPGAATGGGPAAPGTTPGPGPAAPGTSTSSGKTTPAPPATPGTSTGSGKATPAPPGSGPDGAPQPGTTDSPDVYRVALRFGRPGHRAIDHDIARLAPLPSAMNPLFLFLGVLDDGKTALFLVSSDAKTTGAGVCTPETVTCRLVQLKAGDSETFDVATSKGQVGYQLDLLKIEHRQLASQAVAARAHRRESRAGRHLLQVAIDQHQPALQGLAYDVLKGTLHMDPAAAPRAAGIAEGHRFPPVLPAG